MVALHPVLAKRDEAFRADPRMRGLVTVNNTVRSRGQQIILWEGYQAKLKWAAEHPWLPAIMNPYRHYNTAANPYAIFSGAYDVKARYGSWHMEQFSETFQGYYGYAIDYNYSALPRDIKKIFISVAAEYKLVETVFTPQYEPWHYQMAWTDWVWVPAKEMEWDEMATKQEVKEAQIEALEEFFAKDNLLARLHAAFEEVGKDTRDGKETLRAKVDYILGEVKGEKGRTANVLLEGNNGWLRAIAEKVGATKPKPRP